MSDIHTAAKPKGQRYNEIDAATGIAITLVVFGHLWVDEAASLLIYKNIRIFVYQFHMPFFMCLSGFVAAMSLSKRDNVPFADYLASKAQKFFIPYLIFSTVFIASEMVLGREGSEQLPTYVMNALFYPTQSAAGFLWYVYVIFAYYLALPAIVKLAKERPLIVLVLSAAMHFVPMTQFLALHQIFAYMLFFVTGCLAYHHYDTLKPHIIKWGGGYLCLFIAIALVYPLAPLPKIAVGLTSLPAFHYLSIVLNSKISAVFQFLGRYSFHIYLMNTLIIGILTVVLFRVFNLSADPWFAWSMPVLFICGLIGPVAIYRWIIKPTPLRHIL